MKKIIALISAFVMLLSFASCRKPAPQPGDVEPSPIEKAQTDIINSLGITQKDSRIVAYECVNDYVKYVVVYYENGVKTDEETHMFYTNEPAFNAAKEKLEGKSEVTELNADIRYISYWSGDAFNGNYEQDLEKIKENYTIK
ncbi:MAG: hypothetical protein IKW12_03880 [Clostridia bacterium]|nr:hypothetical protein [Clostridia bacterium]